MMQRVQEVALDPNMTLDLWELYHKHPVIKVARQAFDGMAFCQPFTVKLGDSKVKNRRLDILIMKEWMPWVRQVYDYGKMFGIVCYYFEKINEDYVPRIPPFGSGYTTTYMDDNHKQKYHWYWQNDQTQKPDRRMRWIVTSAPTITGEYTSALVSALDDWKTWKIIREASERAAYQAVRQPYIFEYKPPNTDEADDYLRNLVMGDKEAAGEALLLPSMARSQIHQMSKRHLAATLRQKDMFNAGITEQANANQPYLWSESMQEVHRREMQEWEARSLTLNPHFHYVRAEGPKLPVQMKDIAQRLDQFVSNLMDFPLELAVSMHAQRSANIEGNLMTANERIKDVLSNMEAFIREAFLYSYGSVFQRSLLKDVGTLAQLKRSPIELKELLELYESYNVEVELMCSPLIAYNQLRQYWADGIMDKHDFAKHAFQLNRLPERDITVTDEAIDVKAPPAKRAKKATNKEKK